MSEESFIVLRPLCTHLCVLRLDDKPRGMAPPRSSNLKRLPADSTAFDSVSDHTAAFSGWSGDKSATIAFSLRTISLTFVPVSAWHRTKAICCSVDLDFLILIPPLQRLTSAEIRHESWIRFFGARHQAKSQP